MIKDSAWRPLPDFLTIGNSKIEGLGLFALKDLPEGKDLGMTHIFDKRFKDQYIRLLLEHLSITTKYQIVMRFLQILIRK